MQNQLTYLEDFKAMQCFLEKYYKETNSDDIGCLLGEMSFDVWKDMSTGDPATWLDWLQAIDIVKKSSK